MLSYKNGLSRKLLTAQLCNTLTRPFYP